MLKRSLLYQNHKDSGATFVNFRGWQIPKRFRPFEEEYTVLKNNIGLLDLSFQGIIELQGRDRLRFLHGMVTNDIQNLSVGQGCYALMLTPQGKILTDMRIFCSEQALILMVDSDLIEKDIALLRKYIISDQVEVVDRSAELTVVSLQGPKAAEMINLLNTEGNLPTSPFEHLQTDLGGISVRCARISRTTAGGYDLILARTALVDLWNTLLNTGAPLGLQGVGLEAWDVHRLEAGIVWYGFDMDDRRIPLETGLQDAISFNKGCYIGQEVVARATYRGQINRRLTGLLLSGKEPADQGDKIFRNEQEVGWIPSSSYSPRLKQAIALAYIRREAWDPGTLVRVEHQGILSNSEVTTTFFPDR